MKHKTESTESSERNPRDDPLPSNNHQPTTTTTTSLATENTQTFDFPVGFEDRQLQVNGCSRPASISESEAAEMAKRSAKHHKKWNRRLKIFFCCLGYKKNKDSIADVASIFAEYFSDLNAPSSDIAAGFVLLSKYQAAQRQWTLKHSMQQGPAIDQYLSGGKRKSSASKSSTGQTTLKKDKDKGNDKKTKDLRKTNSDEKDKSNKKTREKTTAKEKNKSRNDGEEQVAAGGIDSRHSETTNCNGRQQQQSETLAQIQANAHASIPGQLNEDSEFPIILEDNCCSCNAASAERRLAQHNYEIIYITYKSSINVVPFLVAADHSKQTIVVAIRGSMNLADMVTDLNGTVDKVPIENCPDDWLCHRGITGAASYVKSQLLERHILTRAFNCRPDIGSQDYGLVICGHSLGAGAAAILGVLLRSQYPNLKAYLYSPPGGILSMPVVEYTKQFATGIILGNDTVARLGVAQLERLRYQALLSLKSAQKSPGKILTRALCPSICCGNNEVDYDPEQSLDLLHGTSGRAFDYNNTKIPFQVQPQVLYVPGRLIHVVKNYSFRSKTQRLWSGPIYQAVWTDNSIYDRVIISEGMFLDHLPNNLMHAMKMLFSRTLPGRRDSKLSASVVGSPSKQLSHDATIDEVSSNHEVEVHAEAIETTITNEEDHQQDSYEGVFCDSRNELAQAKNVIEDDDNNNNNNNSEDLNNNNDNAKLYPNLNRSRSSLNIDIKRKKKNSLSGSVSSDLSNSHHKL